METSATNLVPIGRFSRLCRLTIPALRYYDELGLLKPALVDVDSGYRYYSPAQVQDAERIRVLRSLDMPLDEIRGLLAEHDPLTSRERLEQHRRRLLERATTVRNALALLDHLIDQEAGAMNYEVNVRDAKPQHVASVRGHTSVAEMPAFFGNAYRDIFGFLGQSGVRPTGPGFAVYHDPEFREEDVDVEVGVPIDEAIESEGRVVASTLPGGPIAYTLHAGPYDTIGGAYAALDAWVREHGHETVGPPREVYIVGVAETREPGELRTEIDWPIR